MTSSMQARESLGSLSELFTPMLGEEAAAIGAHAPDASPEDKLADDIKKVIAEESAKIRTTSMTEAKLKAEQFHTEHTLTWMPPKELENEVISKKREELQEIRDNLDAMLKDHPDAME